MKIYLSVMGQMYNLFGVFLLFVVPLLQMSDEPFLLRSVGKRVLKCGRKGEFCRLHAFAPSGVGALCRKL